MHNYNTDNIKVQLYECSAFCTFGAFIWKPNALKNSLKGNNSQLEVVCVIFFQLLTSTYKMSQFLKMWRKSVQKRARNWASKLASWQKKIIGNNLNQYNQYKVIRETEDLNNTVCASFKTNSRNHLVFPPEKKNKIEIHLLYIIIFWSILIDVFCKKKSRNEVIRLHFHNASI